MLPTQWHTLAPGACMYFVLFPRLPTDVNAAASSAHPIQHCHWPTSFHANAAVGPHPSIPTLPLAHHLHANAAALAQPSSTSKFVKGSVAVYDAFTGEDLRVEISSGSSPPHVYTVHRQGRMSVASERCWLRAAVSV